MPEAWRDKPPSKAESLHALCDDGFQVGGNVDQRAWDYCMVVPGIETHELRLWPWKSFSLGALGCLSQTMLHSTVPGPGLRGVATRLQFIRDGWLSQLSSCTSCLQTVSVESVKYVGCTRFEMCMRLMLCIQVTCNTCIYVFVWIETELDR